MTGFIGVASKIFAAFLHKNISFSLVALAIITGRLMLKKFPKRYSYALWSCLGVRALFDFALRIKLPKLPGAGGESELGETINSAVAAGQQYIFEIASIDTSAPVKASLTAKEILPVALFAIWVAGILLMVAYGIVNFLKVKKSTAVSFKEESGLYRCDYIESPMAFGFVSPKVFIPSDCDVNAMRFVIEHEKTHIRRGDVYFKLFAFLILCAYWVNPLAWVAFKLFNLDMELSCDESVIRKAGIEKKEEYSRWLVYYSTEERFVSLAPTAFGETDTKRRVKNIMTLKKKGIIATVAGLLITACVVTVCFILNPGKASASASEIPTEENTQKTEATLEDVSAALEDTKAEMTEVITAMEEEKQELEEQLENKPQVITWVSPFPASAVYHITDGYYEERREGSGVPHKAIDIAAPLGTEVLAVMDGTVESAGFDWDSGNYLVIRVNEDITYRYQHLDSVSVEEGASVKAGDTVAAVGSTGRSTGPHLHLEIAINGENVNPLDYIAIPECTGVDSDD